VRAVTRTTDDGTDTDADGRRLSGSGSSDAGQWHSSSAALDRGGGGGGCEGCRSRRQQQSPVIVDR